MDSEDPKNPLAKWARTAQKRLSVAYEESASVLNQSVAIGTIREAVIRGVLQRFIPSMIEVGTGQVIDSQGKLSNQVDIILARGTAPAIRFEGNISAFLYETVLATIEVKSMLYRDKLHEALNNSKSVKDLSYLLHVRSKGPQVFDRGIEWVDSIGGLEQLDKALAEPGLDNAFDCPDDIWQILPFVHFWLHWVKGDFAKLETFQALTRFTSNTEFDFFSNLLASVLGLTDPFKVLTSEFHGSEKIKAEFIQKLYEFALYERLPPDTFVLAYGGYETLDNLVMEVREWYGQNHHELEWWAMPRLILNHKMLMYREFNEYHCSQFEYPVLFLINAIAKTFDRDLSFPVSYGATTGLSRYFDLGLILGSEHPKNAADYLVWSIPLDNSSAGEVRRVNTTSEPSNLVTRKQQRKNGIKRNIKRKRRSR